MSKTTNPFYKIFLDVTWRVISFREAERRIKKLIDKKIDKAVEVERKMILKTMYNLEYDNSIGALKEDLDNLIKELEGGE